MKQVAHVLTSSAVALGLIGTILALTVPLLRQSQDRHEALARLDELVSRVAQARAAPTLSAPRPESSARTVPVAKYVVEDPALVSGTVLFAKGSSKIEEGMLPLLHEVTAILISHPNVALRVETHADSSGPADYNLRLATDRAAAIRDFITTRKVSPNRILLVPLGEMKSRPSTDERVLANDRSAKLTALYETDSLSDVVSQAPTVRWVLLISSLVGLSGLIGLIYRGYRRLAA